MYLFNKHILIIAGKTASLAYLERLESKGEGSATATANVTVEVIARSGAQVKFAAIDRLGKMSQPTSVDVETRTGCQH